MLREQAQAERLAYLNTLAELVKLESPTADKVANDRLADYLEQVLNQNGWRVERIRQEVCGDQLVARVVAPGDRATLILCHFDTVWPVGTLAQMPLKEENGCLYGPGVLDMKAGIANAIHALRLVRQHQLALKGPVTLLLTSDEEVGSEASQGLIERLARAHQRVLVLEPAREDGALKIGRKGVGGFELHFKGISAHAGNNPQDGASALRELAHFLLFAEDLTDYEAGTTLNVTVARAGSVSNVICEEAVAEVDFRALRLSEAERVEKAMKTYVPRDARVHVEVKGGLNRPPLEFTPQNQALFAELQACGKSMGMALEGAVVGGGSDGNFTSALGLATLDGFGGVGEGPHARHEHIRIIDTLDRLALLTALLSN
jgi:glutamate carboxypeptidase